LTELIADIETDGLLRELTRIHCVVLKDAVTGETKGYADQPGYSPISEAIARMEALTKEDIIVFHNGVRFDIPAIKKVIPSFKLEARVRDTLIIARILWPDIKATDFSLVKAKRLPKHMTGRYSLEAFGYRLGVHKAGYKGGWDVWSPDMHGYMLQDAEVGAALWSKCKATVALHRKRNPLAWRGDAVDVEHRVQEIIDRQINHGFLFDYESALLLCQKLAGDRAEMAEKLQQLFPPWFKGKPGVHGLDRKMWRASPLGAVTRTVKDKETGAKLTQRGCYEQHFKDAPFTKLSLHSFNPKSRFDVADRLIKLRGWKPTEFTDDGQPKIDDAILNELPWPEAKPLAELFTLQKRLGQMAEGKKAWFKYIGEDRRLHGEVIVQGTPTARMRHMDPNVAQTPSTKAKYGAEMRKLFIVPKGRKLVGCDADSLEGRCQAGYLARFDGGAFMEMLLKGDKALGTDNHTRTAKALGLDPKAQCRTLNGKMWPGREVGKKFFYTLIYGSADYGLGLVLGIPPLEKNRSKIIAAGKKGREKIMKGFPALAKLIEAIEKEVAETGGILALDGRYLHVRKLYAALNTLLQSAGAIIMKKALVILDDMLQANGLTPGVDYEFVANIHDEWQIEVLEEHAAFIAACGEHSIMKAGEHYKFGCPLLGDATIGSNWKETH
jgi:DNA polymerase-1